MYVIKIKISECTKFTSNKCVTLITVCKNTITMLVNIQVNFLIYTYFANTIDYNVLFLSQICWIKQNVSSVKNVSLCL